jgi:hypothetical protein
MTVPAALDIVNAWFASTKVFVFPEARAELQCVKHPARAVGSVRPSPHGPLIVLWNSVRDEKLTSEQLKALRGDHSRRGTMRPRQPIAVAAEYVDQLVDQLAAYCDECENEVMFSVDAVRRTLKRGRGNPPVVRSLNPSAH